MTCTAQFIVLSYTKIGEKSIVVHTLSEEFGRRSFVCTASRMAMFQPLSIIEAEVLENPKSDLWRIRSAVAFSNLNGIRLNVSKNAMSMFLAEVMFRTIKDGACEEGLFQWCRKSILTLDSLQSDFSNYHLWFLFGLCGALGFKLSTEGILPFAGERLKDIGKLLSAEFPEFMLTRLNGSGRYEIAEAVIAYLAFHTESRIEVRSLRVLHDLFN